MDIKKIKAGLSPAAGNENLCSTVLDYVDVFSRTVKKAKKPGFTVDQWGDFAALVDVEHFERVGHQCEVMRWEEYTGFVTQFATVLEWEGTFRRIQERDQVVYLELIEYATVDGNTHVANTMTVYEFNAVGKIVHLDVYLQQAPEHVRQAD